MIASGKILQGMNVGMSLVLVALAGAIGCLIGSIAAYAIGYSGGRPLMLKYGRYVLISQHDADRADAFFQKWGSATTFFSRLLPVVRTYISLPAGIAKMPFVKFCIYTFLGSLPWCLLLAYVGYVLGNHLNTLAPIFHDLDVVILLVVVVLVILYVWRHIRNDRKARAAHATAGAATTSAPAQQADFAAWNQPPQGWGQPQSQSQQQFSQGWGQPQPPQQGWGQQSQPPQPPQQSQWNQFQPRPQAPQPQWGQSQVQQPQQGWGQPQIPQSPQPQPQWGQGQSQPQQPGQPQPWPPQTGR
jgi:membrane protein DedA with SNARE-associated domain